MDIGRMELRINLNGCFQKTNGFLHIGNGISRRRRRIHHGQGSIDVWGRIGGFALGGLVKFNSSRRIIALGKVHFTPVRVNLRGIRIHPLGKVEAPFGSLQIIGGHEDRGQPQARQQMIGPQFQTALQISTRLGRISLHEPQIGPVQIGIHRIRIQTQCRLKQLQSVIKFAPIRLHSRPLHQQFRVGGFNVAAFFVVCKGPVQVVREVFGHASPFQYPCVIVAAGVVLQFGLDGVIF
mmetsp:Transcript_9810/g.17847  ORF Transcript_9810/g.17847 Transcript_9810/m.17847 type:complete len:237 (+) Transcript_9810:334-1044(+)